MTVGECDLILIDGSCAGSGQLASEEFQQATLPSSVLGVSDNTSPILYDDFTDLQNMQALPPETAEQLRRSMETDFSRQDIRDIDTDIDFSLSDEFESNGDFCDTGGAQNWKSAVCGIAEDGELAYRRGRYSVVVEEADMDFEQADDVLRGLDVNRKKGYGATVGLRIDF